LTDLTDFYNQLRSLDGGALGPTKDAILIFDSLLKRTHRIES